MLIVPDHFYEENGVPVFKPTYDEFKDFSTFMKAVDSYGRKAGLIKVIPPKEWRDRLPDISDCLKRVQIKSAIKQDISHGGGLPHGIYRQTNFERREIYSVQRWFELAESEQHRSPTFDSNGRVKSTGQPPVRQKKDRTVTSKGGEKAVKEDKMEMDADVSGDCDAVAKPAEKVDGGLAAADDLEPQKDKSPIEEELKSTDAEEKKGPARHSEEGADGKETEATGETKQARKRKRGFVEEEIKFDVRKLSAGYSEEYCKELERHYWKTVTYVAPIYGADLLGTIFGDFDDSWNLTKLESVLKRLDMTLPGVNTPYLYFGMWKATFAWHLEDMDLYSINYIHFGAPKQWYVIPTAHSKNFENYAKTIFTDEKCPQFLRHKTCVISPNRLTEQQIPVNRLVQHAGEFVVTFPYGYHAGFNLGFNCAESVNFALESWIPDGANAQFCRCVKDSVQLDVRALFNLEPISPPPEKKLKSNKIIRKCVLCPGTDQEGILRTSCGAWAHKRCAMYILETSVILDEQTNEEIVTGVDLIPKDRWALKCHFCKNITKKRARDLGACIQCFKGKCVRAYHVSCAADNDILLTENMECYCPQHDGVRYGFGFEEAHAVLQRPKVPKTTPKPVEEVNYLNSNTVVNTNQHAAPFHIFSTMMTLDDDIAPSFPLPSWNFHVIEYPGLVEDVDSAIKTLGGSKAIEKAFAQDLGHLELRYRPDDEFSHPIYGDVINTCNLMLKVTTRRRKRRQGERPREDDVVVKSEIVGLVTKTCRFRAIADYQTLPDPNDPIVKLIKGISTYNISKIEEFEFSIDEDPRKARSYPPPSFSRIEWPQNYGYRENPSFKVNVVEKGGGEQEFQVLPINRPTKFKFQKVGPDDLLVPTGPLPEALEMVSKIPQEALDQMKTLFENRPIWTRLALINNMSPSYAKHFKLLVPVYAYGMPSGPWRDCWIKYGYDPRKDKTARKYQVIYLRWVKKPQPLSRGKRLLGVEDASQLVTGKSRVRPDQGDVPSETPNSHIFDGISWNGTASMQICDITDTDVVPLIESGKGVRKVYSEKDGWYETDFRNHIKDIVRNKIMAQSGREGKEITYQVPDDEEEEARENEDEIMEEPEFDNLPDPDAISKKVNASVSRLMQSLQAGRDKYILYWIELKLFVVDNTDEFGYYEDDDDDDE
ncbi:hypothetical protein HDU97_006390 [Phlyctochytrium planicorne]|nr:hypothetical protein HDU97_006390 [Phlyctochytrium planicorne]